METLESFLGKKGVQLSLKLGILGLLILLFLIPKTKIDRLVRDRKYNYYLRTTEMVREMPGNQTFVGPLLAVPELKNVYKKDQYGKPTGEVFSKLEHVWFIPEELNIEGTIYVKKLQNYFYETVTYRSELIFSGHFSRNQFNERYGPEGKTIWGGVKLFIAFSDYMGIKEVPHIIWNDNEQKVNSGIENFSSNKGHRSSDYNYQYLRQGIVTGLHPDELLNDGRFSFELKMEGSEFIYFTPTGKVTNVSLKSKGAIPEFEGLFKPASFSNDSNQLSAKWEINYFNSGIPLFWDGERILNVHEKKFGFNYVDDSELYEESGRVVDFMIMVILLNFLFLFLIEVIHKQKTNIFHYIMTGISLSAFFLMLVALSEFIDFRISYSVSAVLVIGLNTLYSSSFFKGRKSIFLFMALSTLVFAIIFIIIQLVVYSLFAGAIGLFLLIAFTMFITRKINWFEA